MCAMTFAVRVHPEAEMAALVLHSCSPWCPKSTSNNPLVPRVTPRTLFWDPAPSKLLARDLHPGAFLMLHGVVHLQAASWYCSQRASFLLQVPVLTEKLLLLNGIFLPFPVEVDQFPSEGDLAPNSTQSQTLPCQCKAKWPREVWVYDRQLSFNQVNCHILTWAVPTWKIGSSPFHIESPGFMEEMTLLLN